MILTASQCYFRNQCQQQIFLCSGNTVCVVLGVGSALQACYRHKLHPSRDEPPFEMKVLTFLSGKGPLVPAVPEH
jgi:hypothetical protein